ncbi:MAG: histidine--tRNA ligase [Kofleriaceae bacterium]|nr:histidine--tRNA ligase [Kofleriaceae bacterium]
MIKPRTMPGVMELLPRDQLAFQRMLDTIRAAYERFGFLPIETPVIELTDVLLTKSGGETERQVYFVQSTGSLDQAANGAGADRRPELALRFDLTVPLARYVAEHEHELTFPFRRYQMQRVYRGERAQRGRFREFYQCDVDVVGKDTLSPRYDAELPAVIHAVFTELGVGDFTIRINNRALMRGLLEDLGLAEPERQAAVLREVDKLDKRGADAVRTSLTSPELGLGVDAADQLMGWVQLRSRSHAEAMAILAELPVRGDTARRGADELRTVLEMIRGFGVPEARYALDLSIARGLDYYTGTVFETVLDAHPQIGAICSGGRYDNLAGFYTKSHLPGVGVSIGATRLFDQLRQLGVFTTAPSSVTALVALLDDTRLADGISLANQLRAGGVCTELAVDARKLAKQIQYADRAGIRFVVICGEAEAARGVVAIKDLVAGTQREVARADLVAAFAPAPPA